MTVQPVDTFTLKVPTGDCCPGQGEPEMPATDLPVGVNQLMMTETAGNIQNSNRVGRDGTAIAGNILQFAAVRNFDELGAVESRATSGVIATPVAGPTTQAQ